MKTNIEHCAYNATLPLGGSDVSASGEGPRPFALQIIRVLFDLFAAFNPSPRLGSPLPKGGWQLMGALIAMVVVALAATPTTVAASDDVDPEAVAELSSGDQAILDSFMAHIDQLESVADRRDEIKQSITELGGSAADAITEGLILIYPQYIAAVEASDDDEMADAIKLLTPMTDSDDSFLAADATFLLSRTYMNHERYEDAIVQLERLAGDLGKYSAHQGPARYFLGLAQAGLLQKDEAFQSFIKFLKENPDAPERMRVSAWRQAQNIEKIEDGKLEDIYRRMDFSRRRLQQQKTDQSTQDQQNKIVMMLNKLIKEAEKKEASSSPSNTKKPQDKKPKPSQQAGKKPKAPKPSPSKSDQNKNGGQPNGTAVLKNYDDSPASPWSRLRDRSRDPANNAVKEKLPARYRDIVERYMEAANGEKDN